ncbi:MAG: hypothetical protein K2P80_01615 [Beijerinckiaceae bacterium]|nr:hypothetical protein [Beijerinckiaceae bacterium]
MTAASLKRGWCPGALRPMQTGDGLLVRLRLTAGRFTPIVARLVAEASARHGNGEIDLSQRANLQLRGVTEATLAPLTTMLDAAGLIDRDERSEAARNVIASPASDLDATALIDAADWAARIEKLLVDIAAARPLPAKFGVLVDDGGAWPLAASHADIRLEASVTSGQLNFAVALAGTRQTAVQIGKFSHDDTLPLLKQLCTALPSFAGGARPAGREDVDLWLSAAGLAVQTAEPVNRSASEAGLPGATILRPPFGRLSHRDLSGLAECLDNETQAVFRLTTSKALIVGPLQGDERQRLDAYATRAGFLSVGDPLERVLACVGAPACGNATTDTRTDAIRLAGLLPAGQTLHVSGCAKGCATRGRSDLVLVGHGGLYKLGRACKASDFPADGVRMSLTEVERTVATNGFWHA